MAFQAVIGPQTLKSFTKSLTCLSRYGDDVVIQASPESLCLSATSSSKSAFCRVKFTSEYFDKYKLKAPTPPGMTFQTPPDVEDLEHVTGQLLVKSLLSILKHKTVEKTVDRCDLSIVEGGGEPDASADADKEDSLASKLIIRLHCKHGVVKTHRLLLLTPTSLLAPSITSSPADSRVTVGPRALKDILEHFPHAKGSKSDPQLVWLFAANDVKVKSMEFGGAAKGKSQISTEIAMSADEFDTYIIYEPPVSLAFHLREFNATIALAESLSVALDLRFTEPAAPICIEFDSDNSDSEYLFVISTSQVVFDSPSGSKPSGAANLRKRVREDDQENEGASRAGKKTPLRAAIKATSASESQASHRHPSAHPRAASRASVPADDDRDTGPNADSISGAPARFKAQEPLFMPGASQLSNADLDVLRGSGLGIEHMDYDEFEAMMEAEGEEVGMSTAVGNVGDGQGGNRDQEWDGMDEEMDDYQQMGPSQVPVERRGEKEFRPLFDD